MPRFVVLVLASGCLFGQTSPLLEVMRSELDRNFKILKEKADPAPYFVQYGVVEQQSRTWSATLGALQRHGASHNRVLDVSVRTGSPEFDNYRTVGGDRPGFASATLLPIEDKPDDIRRRLWLETDRTWRRASQRLINLKTKTQVNVAAADTSADFSREEPAKAVLPVDRSPLPDSGWADRTRKWSAAFAKYPEVLASGVSVQLLRETKYLVNTEGTGVQHGRNFARITISARGKAPDGMDLLTTGSFEAAEPSHLPEDSGVIAEVDRVGRELQGLLKAPVVDPFAGPAILSGRAAAVFFHEIFGHRIEGHRQKDETEGQTFTKMVGSSVLPEFLSVVFDPTRKQVNGLDLNGTYGFDDEGVRARPVTVVEKGILKTFLMSRSPVQGFPVSNGHGRKQPGLEVVSRQSNLIVESTKQVPETKLREMLVAEIKRQNKPYGFLFDQVTGGFTTTGRRGLQAYTVIPLIVYRIYPDGRPDELVRGVNIVGTPLASFSRILATGDKLQVFNGYCGAESGSVPVSAVSPALLVSEIEIQKKDKGQDRPPILPVPSMAESGGL
ncbi:MAG TPA: metallopeptidase TldD-related protein [Bryobacteraceae bacterium]|nr:metallopeptidase TldD-related protein [Bryobacteraceae bacterium]